MINFLQDNFKLKRQALIVVFSAVLLLFHFASVRIIETDEVKWETDCTFSEMHKKNYPIFMCNKERVITTTKNDKIYLAAEKRNHNPVLVCEKLVGSMSESIKYKCGVRINE